MPETFSAFFLRIPAGDCGKKECGRWSVHLPQMFFLSG